MPSSIGFHHAPIRWIVDDVVKFLKSEIKRGTRYEGIILDPPSFGRGSQGEVFKIERDIHEILQLCREVLSENPLFLIFTTHTPGMTPIVMGHLLRQKMQGLRGQIETGEMILPSEKGNRDSLWQLCEMEFGSCVKRSLVCRILK